MSRLSVSFETAKPIQCPICRTHLHNGIVVFVHALAFCEVCFHTVRPFWIRAISELKTDGIYIDMFTTSHGLYAFTGALYIPKNVGIIPWIKDNGDAQMELKAKLRLTNPDWERWTRSL